MKHSVLARLIAGNNRSAERPNDDKQPARQKPDTPDDVDSGTDAMPGDIVERITTDDGDGRHGATNAA